jgi:hypothetical protein
MNATPGGPSAPRRVTKRMRFEIFNRDNFTCRYCGLKAGETELTVDHVVPQALGGDSGPANLVTACKDCNAGKSSSHPDAEVVAQVADDAVRWARAMREVGERRRRDAAEMEETFLDRWLAGGHGMPKGSGPYIPGDFGSSLNQWVRAGLELEDILRLAGVALARTDIRMHDRFTYLAGCCWNEVKSRQAEVRALLNAPELPDDDPGPLDEPNFVDMAAMLLDVAFTPNMVRHFAMLFPLDGNGGGDGDALEQFFSYYDADLNVAVQADHLSFEAIYGCGPAVVAEPA